MIRVSESSTRTRRKGNASFHSILVKTRFSPPTPPPPPKPISVTVFRTPGASCSGADERWASGRAHRSERICFVGGNGREQLSASPTFSSPTLRPRRPRRRRGRRSPRFFSKLILALTEHSNCENARHKRIERSLRRYCSSSFFFLRTCFRTSTGPPRRRRKLSLCLSLFGKKKNLQPPTLFVKK